MTNDSSLMTVGDHIQLALKECEPEIARFTRPLFGMDEKDSPVLFASCVLLEFDERVILVTAAHAVYEIAQSGSDVHLGARNLIDLPIEGFTRTSMDGKNDPLDTAAIELSQQQVLEQGLESLPIARTTFQRDFRMFHGRCVYGYPLIKE